MIPPPFFKSFIRTISKAINKDSLNLIVIDSKKPFLVNKNFSALNISLSKWLRKSILWCLAVVMYLLWWDLTCSKHGNFSVEEKIWVLQFSKKQSY